MKTKSKKEQQLFADILILQLHDRLDCPVVVIEIDGADHFGAFEVTNLHCDFADGVATNELDNLLCGRIAGVYFDGWQFYILVDENKIKIKTMLKTILRTVYTYV